MGVFEDHGADAPRVKATGDLRSQEPHRERRSRLSQNAPRAFEAGQLLFCNAHASLVTLAVQSMTRRMVRWSSPGTKATTFM
jgi:hypothetical protein